MGYGFPKKWENKLPAGYKDTATSYNEEELRTRIVELEKEVSAAERDMEDDEKLKGAKELVKDLGEGYRDLINKDKACIKFLVYLLESQGK